jgi:hypothetical protein
MPPLLALTAPSPSSFRAEVSIAGEPPFHRLPSRGNPAIEFAGPPSLSPAPRSELSGTLDGMGEWDKQDEGEEI